MDRVISKEYRNKPCPTCGAFTNRGPCIDAIIEKDGKMLFIKRDGEPYKGYWGLVGGYLEWDESYEDCVKREVKEESSLDVMSMKLLNVYSSPKRSPVQSVTAVFVVNAEGEVKAGDDAVEAKWFSINEIPEVLAFDHEEIVKDYLSAKVGKLPKVF